MMNSGAASDDEDNLAAVAGKIDFSVGFGGRLWWQISSKLLFQLEYNLQLLSLTMGGRHDQFPINSIYKTYLNTPLKPRNDFVQNLI